MSTDVNTSTNPVNMPTCQHANKLCQQTTPTNSTTYKSTIKLLGENMGHEKNQYIKHGKDIKVGILQALD
jgi:hypothetical protein